MKKGKAGGKIFVALRLEPALAAKVKAYAKAQRRPTGPQIALILDYWLTEQGIKASPKT